MNNSNSILEENEIANETIIAQNAIFKGEIKTDGDVRVFGTFEGNITCESCWIEENGAVIGDIDAETVSVAGDMKGEVSADNFIVAQSANIEGNITALRYGIEPGATIPSASLSSPNLGDAGNQKGARRHPRVVMPHQTSSRKAERTTRETTDS